MTRAVPGSTRGRRLIAVGDSVPRMSFPLVGAPGRASWNQGTMASVIFAPHLGGCADCERYLDQLATAVEGLREWATRAMVVVSPAAVVAAARPGGADRSGILLLADDDGGGRTYLGLGDDQAAVVQADRWGAVYEVETIGSGGTGHARLPSTRDLVTLAQFIDIQCPECEVPSNEWLSATPFPLG